MRVTLGFDTSCYTTSAAAVDEHGTVVAAERMLLPVREGQRGLRQSEAVFAHVRQMPQVMEALSRRLAGVQVVAVCASARPRDGEDSYMPVFTVGLGHASVLASTLGVPLYETSHQQGHIAAGLIGNAAPKGPFVALHLSGGTTELLDCREGRLELLGGSEDLHAGQLVDRVGWSGAGKAGRGLSGEGSGVASCQRVARRPRLPPFRRGNAGAAAHSRG